MTATNLTEEQRQLLWKIHQYSETSRRTDKLATCMRTLYGQKWDNSHVAFIGLQLRALGLVTTFKDSSDYARWDITVSGRALAVETKNVGKPAKEAPVTVPVPCEYTLFYAGNYHLRLNTEDEALHKAKAAAEQGHEVTVCEVKAVAKVRRILEVSKP